MLIESGRKILSSEWAGQSVLVHPYRLRLAFSTSVTGTDKLFETNAIVNVILVAIVQLITVTLVEPHPCHVRFRLQRNALGFRRIPRR